MSGDMDRKSRSEDVVIANGGHLSTAFDFSAYTMGVVRMPSAWTAASIGFHTADTEGGTYLPLYDDNGNLIQVDNPATSKGYSFPPEVAGCKWLKLWSQDGAGSDTAQAAERTIGVDLKA